MTPAPPPHHGARTAPAPTAQPARLAIATHNPAPTPNRSAGHHGAHAALPARGHHACTARTLNLPPFSPHTTPRSYTQPQRRPSRRARCTARSRPPRLHRTDAAPARLSTQRRRRSACADTQAPRRPSRRARCTARSRPPRLHHADAAPAPPHTLHQPPFSPHTTPRSYTQPQRRPSRRARCTARSRPPRLHHADAAPATLQPTHNPALVHATAAQAITARTLHCPLAATTPAPRGRCTSTAAHAAQPPFSPHTTPRSYTQPQRRASRRGR